MCFVDCKCKSLKKTRRKQNNRKKHKQKHKSSKENRNKHVNTGFPAHEPPRQINISKGLAGRFMLFSVCFMFSFEFLMFCFINVFICVLSIVNAKT